MSDYEHEEWRPIPGFEGLYEVSNRGQIKSLIRKGRLLNPHLKSDGYLITSLRKNGAAKTTYVHQAVAAAFIGKCPDGCEVNHIDLNKSNNTPKNLEYISHAANIHHARNLGHGYGGKTLPARIQRRREQRNDEIVSLYQHGFSRDEIASRLGISAQRVAMLLAAPTDGDNQS